MLKRTGYFVLICCLCFSSKSMGQDPNFSQFFVSPLTLNPALTGKFNGSYRIAGNYRNQWPSINNAFTTATASMDFHILPNSIPEVDQFGIGVMGFNDVMANGVLKNNYLSISTAYHKGLDEDGINSIGFGFLGTYTQKRLDLTRAVFEDQLTTSGFTGVSNETIAGSNLNVNHFDLSAGAFYNGSTAYNNYFYFGVSMYHINQPRESFQNGLYYLNQRYTFHGGGYFPVNNNTTFHTAFIHSRQASAKETNLGGTLEFKIDEDEYRPVSFYAGGWYRLKDAVIPYIGLEYGDLRFGVSYDVNTSNLSAASGARGGIELSLIYIRRPSDPNRKKTNCPKF